MTPKKASETTCPTTSSAGLRVLLWSPKGAGLHYGGPGMTAYRLYRKAPPDSFALTLAHGKENHPSYDLFQANQLIYPLRDRGHASLGGLWAQHCFIQRGRQWVRENTSRYDVFHGLQGFDLTMQPAIEAQRRGLPAVVKLAAHRSDFADKPGWRKLLGRPRHRRKLAARLSAIIAISAAIRDELRSYGIAEDKIAMIPNGVDTDQFRPCYDTDERRELREQFGWTDRPTVLFVGGINRRKRPHLIAEAVAQLANRGHDLQLVLAGPVDDRPYFDEIQSLLGQSGLRDQLIHVPFTPDIAPLYRAAEFFCLPSSSEGMPNAVLEAMASGLACVGTSISGITDLSQDQVTGWLTKPNAAAIAHALSELINNPDSAAQLGAAAHAQIHRSYSSHAVLDQHEQLFRRILQR